MHALALTVLGIEHDSESGSDGLWTEVATEDGAYGAVVAVRFNDTTPDHSELGVLLDGLGSVDIGHTLSEVVRCSLRIVDAF